MKTKHIILLAAALLVISQFSAIASDGEKTLKARNELQTEITKRVKNVPFELVSNKVSENVVHVLFVVNEQGSIDELTVEGKNETLAHYVKTRIQVKELDSYPELAGLTCHVPVRYKVLPK